MATWNEDRVAPDWCCMYRSGCRALGRRSVDVVPEGIQDGGFMNSERVAIGVLLALCLLLIMRDCVDTSNLQADAAEASAAMWADSARVLAEDNEILANQIEQMDTAYVVAQRERDVALATSRAQIDAARANADAVVQDLRASLDSAQAALLADYEAEVEDERQAYHQTILNQATEIVQLRDRVAARDELIAGLYAEIDALNHQAGELREANDALRAAIRSQNKHMALLRVGGVVLLGAAIYGQVAK